MKNTQIPKAAIELISGQQHGEVIVKVCFKYNKGIIATIKSIPGRRWRQEKSQLPAKQT